jgi:hypothetical protein
VGGAGEGRFGGRFFSSFFFEHHHLGPSTNIDDDDLDHDARRSTTMTPSFAFHLSNY